MRFFTKTCRCRSWALCTLANVSIFLMRDAVFLWVMNLEDCTLSTSSFSSGSSKVRLAT